MCWVVIGGCLGVDVHRGVEMGVLKGLLMNVLGWMLMEVLG